MRKQILYEYNDVVLEQQIDCTHLDGIGTKKPLYAEHNASKLLGFVFNMRFTETPSGKSLLVGDLRSSLDLKGLYPSIAVQVLKKDSTSGNMLQGRLLHVSASASLNIDETLEPFI